FLLTLMFPRQASKRLCAGGCLSRPPALNSVKESVSRETLRSRLPVRRCGRKVGSTLNSVRPGLTSLKQRERVSAFTLLELLIVIGIIAVFASKDGTNLWSANNALPPASLMQVGKMITLNNIHIGDTGVPSGNGTEFESRETVDTDHRISTSANTPYPFTVQQTTFNKWI